MEIVRFLRDFFQPLPNPKKEADKFFASPLNRLFFDQLEEIVRFIIDEARRSREFGLYIKQEHIEKEELFFLAVINGLGGIWRMRRVISFSDAQSAISELMWDHFEQELQYYFELSQKRNDRVPNKYNCHLESVRNRLLHEIYNVPNKEFNTA